MRIIIETEFPVSRNNDSFSSIFSFGFGNLHGLIGFKVGYHNKGAFISSLNFYTTPFALI